MVLPDLGSAAALGTLLGGTRNNLIVHLAGAPPQVAEGADAGTLTESAWPGYAPARVAWSVPVAGDDGTARSYSLPYAWSLTEDLDAPAHVTAYWVVGQGAAGGQVLVVKPFRPPVVLSRRGQRIDLQLGVTAALDTLGGADLVLGWDEQLSHRGRPVLGSDRRRWKHLRRVLALVWDADMRAAGVEDRTGADQVYFFLDPAAADAARRVKARLDELLRRERSARPDFPLQEQLVGVIAG